MTQAISQSVCQPVRSATIRDRTLGAMRHLLLLLLFASPAAAQNLSIPVLVPITGFLAVEGASQRNGATLALKQSSSLGVTSEVTDTGTSPEVAVNALERALDDPDTVAAVGPILGTQMLAMLPVATEARLPLLTISGTASLTQSGNPYVFRFFPDDATTVGAQLRYALDVLHVQHPALITQTTAYGQSGRAEMLRLLAARGITPADDDALDVSLRDMAPVLAKAAAAGADALLLHLHAGPTALLVKTAAATSPRLPIVAGSGLVQPAALALLAPEELTGICAETGSSPVSGETAASREFTAAYRAAFRTDPDAFAAAQYDATRMALQAIAQGTRTRDTLTRFLSSGTYDGVAMRYRSDGSGNMAHSAVVVCFDGKTRTPSVARHYDSE